jgi:hypothetical protein
MKQGKSICAVTMVRNLTHHTLNDTWHVISRVSEVDFELFTCIAVERGEYTSTNVKQVDIKTGIN